MRACSYPSHVHDAGARRRFAAALLVSASAHVLVTSSVAPGPAGRSRATPVTATRTIEARLFTPEVPPVVATPIEPATPPEPALVSTTPHKVPSRRVDAPVAAAPEAAAGSAQLVDLTYYGARQLDVYPVLTGALDLRHPGAAQARARVLFLVLIDAGGIVDDVSVVESAAPGPWDETARRALMTARFEPALRSGRPVKSRLVIEIDYSTAESTQ